MSVRQISLKGISEMAGYSKLYCVGGLGGFQGADGINPIFFQILVGDADRQWLEVHYFDKRIKSLGNISVIIPEAPNHPNSLLDACIAFYPTHFESCSLLAQVEQKIGNLTRLDFHLGQNTIPEEWYDLRAEALPLFKTLNIFEANLTPVNLEGYKV